MLPDAGWIDPCPFWDEDGRAYLVAGVAKSRMGYNNVLFLSEMKPDGMGLIGPEVKIYDGDTSQQNTVEGPKLYKRNGWYYIFAPAGGVKIGWQIVLRSRNIWGPYDSRIVMMQGNSTVNGPHQGAWVNTPDGEDWFLHFQDVYAAGRIIHLQPMTWQEDWPVIGAAKEGQSYGEPVASFRKPHASTSADSITMVTSDDFADGQLNPAWQWNANPKPDWYHCSSHRLVLRAIAKADVYADQPNLLLQKWPAPDFRCIYKLDLSGLTEGDEAGVISLGTDYGLVAFERIAQEYRVRSILGTQHFGKILVDTTTEQATEPAMIEGCQSTVYVKYIVEPCGTRDLNETEKGFPSERVRILYSVDGTTYTEALVMTSMPGRWVGTKNGLFCVHRQNKYKAMSDGHCLVEYVHYER